MDYLTTSQMWRADGATLLREYEAAVKRRSQKASDYANDLFQVIVSRIDGRR